MTLKTLDFIGFDMTICGFTKINGFRDNITIKHKQKMHLLLLKHLNNKMLLERKTFSSKIENAISRWQNENRE